MAFRRVTFLYNTVKCSLLHSYNKTTLVIVCRTLTGDEGRVNEAVVNANVDADWIM